MNKTEKKTIEKMTRSDAELLAADGCIASVRLDELTALMNEDIARVREKYQEAIEEQSAALDRVTDALKVWADAHPG